MLHALNTAEVAVTVSGSGSGNKVASNPRKGRRGHSVALEHKGGRD